MKKRKRYLIVQILLDSLNGDRKYWSKNKKMLRLYNKNGLRWQTFYNVKKENNIFGYFGETKNLDEYWRNVIIKK